MELFTVIDDAHAILRLPKGVQKQVKLYKRKGRVFVPHAGGYIEVRAKEYDDSHSTAHPDIKVLEFECDGHYYEKEIGQQRLRYRAPTVRAVA